MARKKNEDEKEKKKQEEQERGDNEFDDVYSETSIYDISSDDDQL